MKRRLAELIATAALLACVGGATPAPDPPAKAPDASGSRDNDRVLPGITVLLTDSLHLIAGRRVGLLTNQSGIDEKGRSDIDLLYGARAGAAAGAGGRGGPVLVSLFAPEHGIRGTEDRTNLASGRDERTGLPIHSLYGATTLAPPDSTLRGLDVLVVDLQDLGARTWTYVAAMVYAMRAAARNDVRVVVLDRPNPITGTRMEGPVLDSTIAYAGTHTAGRPAKPTALYPIPLRHGLTMGELALFYNDALSLGADLRVIPARGWRRDMWFDETGLPWVKPSPNMPNLTSALLYPGLVPFEDTNLSVGRGTPDAFQHVGAPWLDARRVAELLNDREMPGVRFEHERFTPRNPTDGKYAGVNVPGVRIVVTDRDRVNSVRVGVALLWAVHQVHADSLRLGRRFDSTLGSPRAREALLRGDDPDAILDRETAVVVEFGQRVRGYLLYK
ncbi:MAG: exo-beta-N-acetylmuramidase NamZ family protein [Gemmatimonadaceae bacterium]